MKYKKLIVNRDYKYSYFCDSGCVTVNLDKGTLVKVVESYKDQYGIWSKVKFGSYTYPVRSDDLNTN